MSIVVIAGAAPATLLLRQHACVSIEQRNDILERAQNSVPLLLAPCGFIARSVKKGSRLGQFSFGLRHFLQFDIKLPTNSHELIVLLPFRDGAYNERWEIRDGRLGRMGNSFVPPKGLASFALPLSVDCIRIGAVSK